MSSWSCRRRVEGLWRQSMILLRKCLPELLNSPSDACRRHGRGALGRNIRVRLEGLRDEEEAEHLIAAPCGRRRMAEGSGNTSGGLPCLPAALEQSALPGLEASGFAVRLGECADALSLASAQELSNLQEGRAAITLSWLGAIFLRHFACSETSGEGVKIFSVRPRLGGGQKDKGKAS